MELIGSHSVIDLGHALDEKIPLLPFQHPLSTRNIVEYKDGALVRSFTLDEHQGTHVDAPAHFYEGGDTVDLIIAQKLVTMAHLIDVRSKSEHVDNYTVTVEDILAHEESIGRTIDGGVVIAWTGHDRWWQTPERYMGMLDMGPFVFPGFSLESARLLCDKRGVTGIGIDGPSVDAGSAVNYPVHQYTLKHGLYHVENLCNLAAVGVGVFRIIIAPIKLARGSGAPARVFAIV